MRNDTETLTLADFLLARIAEDEEWARWGRLVDDPNDPDSATKILRWDHARLHAECEAKRRIVTALGPAAALDAPTPTVAAGYRGLLGYLAAVYADHPDYRDEWRP